uniref:Uncharacterized protein n=1 Tax=Melopsittacus undulatus TaxID=13146 RepID=A0A8V5H2W8_MELUD
GGQRGRPSARALLPLGPRLPRLRAVLLERPGPDVPPAGRSCGRSCANDTSCSPGHKCCPRGCCTRSKPGLCPRKRVQSSAVACPNRCADDRDCPGNRKCCFSGCGLACALPDRGRAPPSLPRLHSPQGRVKCRQEPSSIPAGRHWLWARRGSRFHAGASSHHHPIVTIPLHLGLHRCPLSSHGLQCRNQFPLVPVTKEGFISIPKCQSLIGKVMGWGR